MFLFFPYQDDNPRRYGPPVVSELDIYRSAMLLVDQHGEDASLEAAVRADAMFERGAMAGVAVWLRFVKGGGRVAGNGATR